MSTTSQLDIGTEGRLGVIALNRPEAINALSLEMIEAISSTLTAWRTDPSVRAVLFEGRGEKGFCAGGDVRHVREQVLAGRADLADRYFATEYRMNRQIATFAKPVIALTQGIVMGGGIGIAGHAAFRITTPEARYAMPEAAIGFVCDVGVNFILAKAPAARALLFAMSGVPVSGADVLGLGLADCCVRPERLDELRRGIVSAANTGDIEPALVALMQSESVQSGERLLCEAADAAADLFELETAGQIVEAVVEDGEPGSPLHPYAQALSRLSPTSLEAIVASHRAARRLPSVGAVLELDLRMAGFCARQPDFAEGVRAQLVEKDRRPAWSPATFAEVDRAGLDLALRGQAGGSALPSGQQG